MIEIFNLEISDLQWLMDEQDKLPIQEKITLEKYCRWFSKGVMGNKIGFREPKAIILYKIEELYKDNQKRAIEVVNLLVGENYKRKGYAGWLKNDLQVKFPEIQYYQGWVNSKNIPMINLNKKLGFKIVDVNKEYYKNGDDALVFIKEINGG